MIEIKDLNKCSYFARIYIIKDVNFPQIDKKGLP